MFFAFFSYVLQTIPFFLLPSHTSQALVLRLKSETSDDVTNDWIVLFCLTPKLKGLWKKMS